MLLEDDDEEELLLLSEPYCSRIDLSSLRSASVSAESSLLVEMYLSMDNATTPVYVTPLSLLDIDVTFPDTYPSASSYLEINSFALISVLELTVKDTAIALLFPQVEELLLLEDELLEDEEELLFS